MPPGPMSHRRRALPYQSISSDAGVPTRREKYIAAGIAAGCPIDQMRNFGAGRYAATAKGLEFHALARAADSPTGPVQIGMGGARGGSKSHTTFAQVVFDDCVRQRDIKALFLRSIGKAARESFEDLIKKVCPQYWGSYRPGLGRLDLPNNGRILFGGFRSEADIDKYLGIEYDIIVPEENNLLTENKHNELRGSLRTSKPNWRPRLYSTFNPGGVGHAHIKRTFIEPWRKHMQTDSAFVFATYKDNPYIDQAYREYLEGLTGWLGRAWRDGDWDVLAGQFFTTFRPKLHVEDFGAVYSWKFWMGFDYGFQHYTSVHLFGQDNQGGVHVIDEHCERKWQVVSHVRGIRAMLQRHGIRYMPRCVAGNDVYAKKGEEATIAEQYERAGLTLEHAQMNRINGAAEILKRFGDVEQGVPQSVWISPRCARLIETLPVLEHDPHRPEDVLKVDADSEGNGGDDTYDSFRYGLMEAADTGRRVVVIPR